VREAIRVGDERAEERACHDIGLQGDGRLLQIEGECVAGFPGTSGYVDEPQLLGGRIPPLLRSPL